MTSEVSCFNSQPVVDMVKFFAVCNRGEIRASVGDYEMKNVVKYENLSKIKLEMKDGSTINLEINDDGPEDRYAFACKLDQWQADIVIEADKK
jgi:hypothetical protein